jgi:VIT1/CCC1 family predicted Fe2+/Mn2+ transporter
VLTAHAEAELGVHPDDLASPGRAALASGVAFVAGAILPLVAILLPPVSLRVWVTVAAALFALAIAGAISARIGDSSVPRAVARVVIGGAAGLALTWGIGYLFGSAIG